MTSGKGRIVSGEEAMGLWSTARKFLQAAKLLADDSPRGSVKNNASFPFYYLAGHAEELALKAFICSNHPTAEEVLKRTLGHDLEACLRRAEELGLSQWVGSMGDLRSQTASLNAYYERKLLEYFQKGTYSFGRPLDVLKCVEALVRGVKEPCYQAYRDWQRAAGCQGASG